MHLPRTGIMANFVREFEVANYDVKARTPGTWRRRTFLVCSEPRPFRSAMSSVTFIKEADGYAEPSAFR